VASRQQRGRHGTSSEVRPQVRDRPEKDRGHSPGGQLITGAPGRKSGGRGRSAESLEVTKNVPGVRRPRARYTVRGTRGRPDLRALKREARRGPTQDRDQRLHRRRIIGVPGRKNGGRGRSGENQEVTKNVPGVRRPRARCTVHGTRGRPGPRALKQEARRGLDRGLLVHGHRTQGAESAVDHNIRKSRSERIPAACCGICERLG